MFTRGYRATISLMLSLICLNAINPAQSKEAIAAVPVGTLTSFSPGTLGFELGALLVLTDEIRKLADDVLGKGDQILSRQLYVVSDTIQSAIQQIETAYSDQLDHTMDRVDSSVQKGLRDLRDTIDRLDAAVQNAGATAENVVNDAATELQTAMDRLPLIKKTPVFMGVIPRDLLGSLAQGDIEIRGYRLWSTKKSPEIKINGKSIDSANIRLAAADRIAITLPADILSDINANGNSCSPILDYTLFPAHWDPKLRIPRGQVVAAASIVSPKY